VQFGKMRPQLLLPIIKGHRTPQCSGVYRRHLRIGISVGDCTPPRQKSQPDIQFEFRSAKNSQEEYKFWCQTPLMSTVTLIFDASSDVSLHLIHSWLDAVLLEAQ